MSSHQYDDDCVCIKCGHDDAERYHLNRMLYVELASYESCEVAKHEADAAYPEPPCAGERK